MFNNFFFFRILAVYEIMLMNIVEPCRPQITMWRIRVACWIKATNMHSEYVIITVFYCNSDFVQTYLSLR